MSSCEILLYTHGGDLSDNAWDALLLPKTDRVFEPPPICLDADMLTAIVATAAGEPRPKPISGNHLALIAQALTEANYKSPL